MQSLTEQNSTYSIIKKLSLLSLCCLSFALFSFAYQGDDYKLVTNVEASAEFMTTDKLKNVYVINKERFLIRYDSTGKATGGYNDTRYGKLGFVDATSPFNILLFYPDFSTAVMVDNTLNAKTLYKMPSIGINNVSAACLSYDNYIWVFDRDESKLKKVNRQYEVIYESLDLSTILGMRPNPRFLIEREDFIFLSDPDLGLILFDIFGNYINSYPIMGLETFQIFDGKIVFYDGTEMRIFNYRQQNWTDDVMHSLPVPDSGEIQDVKVERGHLFLRKDGDIQIYRNR